MVGCSAGVASPSEESPGPGSSGPGLSGVGSSGTTLDVQLRRVCDTKNLDDYVRLYADSKNAVFEVMLGGRVPSGDTTECRPTQVLGRRKVAPGEIDVTKARPVLSMPIDADAVSTWKTGTPTNERCAIVTVCEDTDGDGACGGMGIEPAIANGGKNDFPDITTPLSAFLYVGHAGASFKSDPASCDDAYAP